MSRPDPQRIALAFPGCHRRGGVERVMVEAANFLADRGHAVHVFASEIDPGVLSPAVVPHTIDCGGGPELLRTARFTPRSTAAIESLAAREGPFAGLGTFGVVGPENGTVWVQSVHATWIDIARSSRSLSGRLRQRLNPFHPFILRREKRHFGGRHYRRLIALTADVRDDLVRHYAVPESDIDVLPNGFSPTEFNVAFRHRDRAARRAALGYTDTDKVVVFVANETERKGLLPLLRGVAALNDPTIKVLAVGRLDPAESASTLAQTGLGDRVRFTGPSAKVADFYAAADVFALPTKYEAWGLVIVEAMACGLPVLTSRLAGAAIAVREGQTGYLLDSPSDPAEIAQKLQRLLTTPHAPPEEISASVQPYTWQKVLERYEQILLPLTPPRAPTPTHKIPNPKSQIPNLTP